MAHIAILGAGTGGMPAAYELRAVIGAEHRITVINAVDYFQFVPSNPWRAVGWRKREEVVLQIAPLLARKGIACVPKAVTKIDPQANRLEFAEGEPLAYDYLVITTGPRLSFDEVPGAGPVASGGGGHTHSICHVDHAVKAEGAWQSFVKDPGPIVVGAVQGASCFGPAYEFAFIMDTDLRRRKLRDRVPMTLVTSEPYIGHLGLGGIGPAIAIGMLVGKAMEALGRNPEARASIQTNMILGVAFAEAIGIYALLTALIIAFVI